MGESDLEDALLDRLQAFMPQAFRPHPEFPG